jgi:hypothetical protein
MWFLIPLFVGLAVAASRSRAPRLALPAPPQSIPSPVVVLGEFARTGRPPPPQLIMCALAEAEMCGRQDIAIEIVRIYIAPVVYAHDLAMARDANPEPGEPQAPAQQVAPQTQPQSAPQSGPRAVGSLSEDELQWMLDHDPEGFHAAMNRGYVDGPVLPEQPVIVSEPQQVAPPESAPPVVGVAVGAWSEFCDRLEREPAQYESSRHVGRYRQRRDRLTELGIDPAAIVGDPYAQRAALETDLGDAYQRLAEEGDIAKHVGRLIPLPGEDGLHRVTLSGVLGVVQAAGLENAIGWLESPRDRVKFQHTTQAFKRANGAF